jgi:ATP-dependent RNA helicase DeaD
MSELNFRSLGIREDIIKSLEKLGYEKPTEVQEKAVPRVLEGKDIIVKSQTGSGKTAAFGIPVCEKIEVEKREPQALVLVPTRELAVQVKEDITNIGRLKKIRCAAVFGKQPMAMQERELRQRVHIVVGTPGRTLDHIERGNLKLEEIKYLILDEADEMLNMGFIEQVESVIKGISKNRITMLFSATMPEKIQNLCAQYMIEPISIEINPEKTTTEEIEQAYYDIEENKKISLLNKIIYTEHPESCIIFCNTKDEVDKLVQRMKAKGFSCDKLHGGMEQKDRLETMQKFKKGEFIFLVATDVAARGIDIENITHVINFNVPFEKESYVHRIGRTGRAGKKGIAISFVSSNELRIFKEIEEFTGAKIVKREIPTEEDVETGRKIFKEKIHIKPNLKREKGEQLNKDITKVYLNAGKKKKIRPGDIVGAITSIEGIGADDIGIIDIQDNVSYVDILGGKGRIVLDALQDTTIKGKKVRVQAAKK